MTSASRLSNGALASVMDGRLLLMAGCVTVRYWTEDKITKKKRMLDDDN